MNAATRRRVTPAKLKKAADLALEKGVRVTVGDYVIEPPDAASTSDDEGARVQAKLDGMSAAPRSKSPPPRAS